MSSIDLITLKQRLREFADERDWNQFHSPKNIAMALSVEVAEIVEHFQWLSEEQSKNLSQNKLAEVEAELADTFIYLIRLADKLDIDLFAATSRKLRSTKKNIPSKNPGVMPENTATLMINRDDWPAINPVLFGNQAL